jgi:hypothetical protein
MNDSLLRREIIDSSGVSYEWEMVAAPVEAHAILASQRERGRTLPLVPRLRLSTLISNASRLASCQREGHPSDYRRAVFRTALSVHDCHLRLQLPVCNESALYSVSVCTCRTPDCSTTLLKEQLYVEPIMP